MKAPQLFELPKTESLNLEYMATRLTLIALNEVRRKRDSNKYVKNIAAGILGTSEKTIYTIINKYNISYDMKYKRYYIPGDSIILNFVKPQKNG